MKLRLRPSPLSSGPALAGAVAAAWPVGLLAATPPGGAAPADDGSSMAPWLFLAGVVVIGLTLMRSMRRRGGGPAVRRAATGAGEPPRERLAAIKSRAAGRVHADGVVGATASDLDLATRLAASLDVKAARLERLIADSDERLRRLETAGAIHEPPTGPSDTRGPDPSPDPPRDHDHDPDPQETA